MSAVLGTPEGWEDPGLQVKVYIDDINNIEKVCFSNSVSCTGQEKRRVLAHAQHCEKNFAAVKAAATAIQMNVNGKKPQLLCISGNLDNDVNTYIRVDNRTEIQGGVELKLLGFWFGRKPNADAHIEHICDKFRSRLWALRHLKRAGMPQTDLLKIYQTVLLPVLDFACPTYHSLLSLTQSNQLEALQKHAVKIIFGFDMSYNDIISEGKIQLLKTRRNTLCVKFAQKAAANPAFGSKWFPRRPCLPYETRKQDIYQESTPRTEIPDCASCARFWV